MRHWMKSCGILVSFACLNLSSSHAADPIVQVFDGWKITITPGESSFPGPVPVAAQLASANGPRPESLDQSSSSQQGVPPAPEGVTPPDLEPKPVLKPDVDGLPIITPGDFAGCCDSRPTVSPPEGTVDPRYMPQMYVDLYKSIPFIRAEYNANPSYIHDTAVEFLFGKMRPTVLHRGTVNVNVSSPYSYGTPYYTSGSPYGYGGYGYGGYPGGFAYPPLQLVVPGTGLRIHRLN